jgi:hypothetical protein
MINFFKTLLCSPSIDWTATGTMMIAFGTFVVAYIAWTQLGKTNKISNADFAHRFKNDFFNEKTQQLFMLFDYNLILFKTKSVSNADDEFPYFEVDKTQFDANPIYAIGLSKIKYHYTAYEIDDLLLGHFEDLGLFCKKKLMDIEFIYEGFDYYIEGIHENKQIQNYLDWIRDNKETKEGEEAEEDIYDNFDYLFNKVKCYAKHKKLRSKIKKLISNKWK